MIDAMKTALEALEVCEVHGCIPVRLTRDSVLALRLAIEQAERIQRAEEAFAATSDEVKGEQAEKQEPVACQYAVDVAMPEYRCVGKCQYTAPPQQEKQEPVAWVCEGSASDEKHAIDYWQEEIDAIPVGTMLYAAPPQRQPMVVSQECAERGCVAHDDRVDGPGVVVGGGSMRCPTCGAPTEVLETRPYMGVFSRRTRMCFNEHKTWTYEVPATALDRRQLPIIKRGIKTRVEARHRRLTIIRSPGVPASELAATLGITQARVRQIRSEVMK